MFLDSTTKNDCPSNHDANGCVSKQQIDQSKVIIDKIRGTQTAIVPTFFFSHQGFKEMADGWNNAALDTVYSKNGGNQNISCTTVDSTHIQNVLLTRYSLLTFIAGKELDNRFIIQQKWNLTSVGRAGASNQSTVLKRGALVIELQEWLDRSIDCSKFSITIS